MIKLEKSGISAAWSYLKSPLKSELSDFKDDLTKSGETVGLYIVSAKDQAEAAARQDVQRQTLFVKRAWDRFSKREQDQRLAMQRDSANTLTKIFSTDRGPC